jgi:phage anti-repressor protein
MPDLIPLHTHTIGDKALTAVSARWLHEQLKIKKDFTDWLRQYTLKDDWREDKDYSHFPLEGENPQGGRPKGDAALSIQMAEHIAMMTKTTKGREIREAFRQARDERDTLRVRQPQALTPAQMFLEQAKLNVIIEQRMDALETKVQEITARQPPVGKVQVGEWLRRFHKPRLNRQVMDHLRAACRRREEPETWRPEGYDWPVPYYMPETIAMAYEEITRQLSFINDPPVPYARRNR